MKIIIAGCGKVGETIAKSLNKENHNITLIDKDASKLKLITDRIDVLGVEGNATSLAALAEAGIKGADLLIATTDSDELNILCCLLSKKAGAKHTIARIRDPQFADDVKYIRDELNLSLVINPELAAAEEMARILNFPSVNKIDTFVRGRVELMNLVIPKDSELCGLRIADMNRKLHCKVLICIVERGEETVIPNGMYVLQEGDKVSFIGQSHKTVREFFKAAGVAVTNSIRSVMLIGGGKISYYLAKKLEETNISLKIIDHDLERCRELSEALPTAIIINGDGTDQQLLMEEGIGETDAIGALTGIDEENIMLSLYASSMSNAKTLTKINRITFEDVIGGMNLGSIINPKNITADSIISYVRAMSNSTKSTVETLYKLAGDKAEALEFRAREGSPLIGTPLMQLKFVSNVLIACLYRNGKLIMADGQSIIEDGDAVIVVTTRSGLENLEDILA